MNPEHPDIPAWKPGLLDQVRDVYRGLPAAGVVILTIGLLVLALWLGRVWPPHFWMIHAIKSAPLVNSSSAQAGVVKLSGKAHAASEHAPILLRDESGDCAIDPQEAEVLPVLARSEGQTGYPVFAIGEIQRTRGGKAGESCRLRRSAEGVLLVSGRTAEEALFHFRLYFWPAIAGMFLSLGLAAWGFRAHLRGYPRESIGEFVKALTTRPWARYPGADR